jgi:thiol peroxidase
MSSEEKRTVTFKQAPLTLIGKQLKVGDTAPNFTLTSPELKEVALSDFPEKTVVLSCVPSLDTPVCDIQGKKFDESAKKLSSDIVTLIVSVDTPFAQSRWKAATNCTKAMPLSDYKERNFAKTYGLLIDELKLLSRAVFIIGKDKKIHYVQYVDEITNEPNYEAAFEVLKKIK